MDMPPWRDLRWFWRGKEGLAKWASAQPCFLAQNQATCLTPCQTAKMQLQTLAETAENSEIAKKS